MTMLNRLKLELGNKQYFTDAEYEQFLSENGYDLTIQPVYDKDTMQKMLLLTVLDILQAIANDVDHMRMVETEFATTTDAFRHIQDRIQSVKDRISAIPETDEEYSPFSLMYTRK